MTSASTSSGGLCPRRRGRSRSSLPEGAEAGDSSHASEEASQARSEEKEGREEQAGCRRVRQDLGSETEGGQGGQRAEEEEVRLPPRVQEIRLQPVKARCHRDLVTRK